MALTAQQRQARAMGIGASEAAAACGLSNYKTPLALYLQKIADADGVAANEEELDTASRLRLRGGSALEPIIISEFEERTRLTVVDRQLQVVDPENTWRWVTLDGRASDGALVEAKKTEITTAVWGEGDEDIPDDYYCQTQHGMACTQASLVYVPVLLPRWEFALYVVKRDDEFIKLMTSKQQFFMDCLRTRTPPPVTSLDDAKLLWPKHTPLKSITLPLEIEGIAQELASLKARIKADEEQQKTLELLIKVAMGDAEEALGRTGRIATWRNNKDSKVFDTETFAIAHPDLWKQYQKTKPGPRVFLLKLKAE